MFADGPNPTRVQLVPPHRRLKPPPPLVLIHDGGGTVFSYFILGSLRRDVWAVHNPKYFDAEPWSGGMDKMARHYIDLLADAGIAGPVVLGGWSLGGYLSLAMARMLADDPAATISVVGFLIIDSPYHIARSKLTVATAEPRFDGLPVLVQQSFDNCDDMLQHWDLPPWDGPACRGEQVECSVGERSFALPLGSVLRRPLGSSWTTVDTTSYHHQRAVADPVTPPPAVLIRCTQPVNNKAEETDDPCRVDTHRHETLLGWEGNHPDFIKAVIDFDADHYNIFDKLDNVKMESLTDRLLDGLEILDSLHGPAGQQAPEFCF